MIRSTCLSCLFVALALNNAVSPVASAADHGEMAHKNAWAAISRAVAVIHPTQGNHCHGVVTFTQMGDQVKVVAHLEGLNPGQKHAFHIHEFGDCSAPDGTSCGGHYNPEGHSHGLPSQDSRHAGDLGNVTADGNGKATYEVNVSNISIAGMKNPIIGRGVIVHAKPDDGGQPVGNAGARIGSGTIGIGKS